MGKEDPKFRFTELRKEFNHNAMRCEQNGNHTGARIWRRAKVRAEKYLRDRIVKVES